MYSKSEIISRNLAAIAYIENCGITISDDMKDRIISCPWQEEIFPLILADDGGWTVASCEIPVCQNGDPIIVGCYYKVDESDYVKVTKITLVGSLHTHFLINVDEFGSDNLIREEFLEVTF